MITLILMNLLILGTPLIPREPIYPTRSNISLWIQPILRDPLYPLGFPISLIKPLILYDPPHSRDPCNPRDTPYTKRAHLSHESKLIPLNPTYPSRPSLSLGTPYIPQDSLHPLKILLSYMIPLVLLNLVNLGIPFIHENKHFLN